MEISPIDLMLLVSEASVGASEVPPRSNRGPYVERVLAFTHTEFGKPWCASQFSRWGAKCFGDEWPLPITASVQEICDAAERIGVRYIPSASGKGKPRVGDAYALWGEKENRYSHIGLVIAVGKGTTITARDGNTSGAGERDGWLVWEKERTLTSKDRLIRWAEALK